MTRLLFLLTTSIAFVHSLNNMLVQGRADTLRVLRRIIRDRDAKVMPINDPDGPRVAWSTAIPRDVTNRAFDGPPVKERGRRHINNAVIESGNCEHIDLVDCSEFETDETTCFVTATGMSCCLCTGRLRAENWNLF